MTVDISQFYQTFFEESFEGLDTMESSLLNLDVGEADAETVNSIFRAAHSIKGGSATFGFTNVSGFTHVMETLLDEMRSGQRMVTQESVDLLLESVDCLREMLTAVRDSSEYDEENVAQTHKKLEALLHGEQIATETSAAETVQPESVVSQTQKAKPTGYHISFTPHEHLMRTGNDPVRMFRELEMLGELSAKANLEQFPRFYNIDPTACYISWELELTGDVELAQIEEVFEWVDGDCDLRITPLGEATAEESPEVLEEDKESDPVGSSLQILAEQGEGFARDFYQSLFDKHPAVKPLFANVSIETQQGKLWQILKTLGENLGNLEALRPALVDLGKRHQKYGATSAHYVAVSDVMLGSLEKALGSLWNDTVRDAWTKGLNFAAEVMLGAYEEAAKPVAPAITQPVTQPVADAAPKAAAKKVAAASSENTSIRVSIDKVDALINMVGELVITQSMLGQLGDDMDMSKIEKLQDGLAELERNTRELQESVMRIRMLPISFAFQRFPRMVRDLTQKLGKKIDLVLLGEQTELDKTVMEKIGDPLVHLVRNSVDHGIEKPEVRAANGKPQTGTVTLNAYHQGGNIVIEITDDGAGINKERVLEKAREKGIISATETPSDEQIYDMIFAPGFSTAAEISDVSGRGVGMDVVKKNIRALGGKIEVTSQQGVGSTFTIRLPLTLAILDGQLVRVGKETYIIPLVSIIESIQVKKERVNEIAGQAELYQLRDNYIPILRMYEAFDVVPDSTVLNDGLLVVVEGDGQRGALFVDDLLGQQQVVIKSLETNFKSVEGVSGATILGDGTVALILDVSGLVKLCKKNTGGGGPRGGKPKTDKSCDKSAKDKDVIAENSEESSQQDDIDNEQDHTPEKAA